MLEAALSNPMSQVLLDEIYSKFCHIITTEIHDTFPCTKQSNHSKKPWWNRSLYNARKRAQKAQEQWLMYEENRNVKQYLRRE